MCVCSTDTANESLAAANTQSSLQWRSMSTEEKQRYDDKAKAVETECTGLNVKKECKKILGRLQEVVSLHLYTRYFCAS